MGEVMFRGNITMRGYLKNPEATEKAFAGGWFHSGDLAVVHPDGYLQLRDRSKDIIISGGENISSIEVESVLYRHPDVATCAVVAAPDVKWGETPVAVVERRDGATITEADLVAFCREHLAGITSARARSLFDELAQDLHRQDPEGPPARSTSADVDRGGGRRDRIFRRRHGSLRVRVRPSPPGKLANATLLLSACLTVMAGGDHLALAAGSCTTTMPTSPGVEVLSRLVLTLPALFIALCSPLAGLAVDRLGRKPVILTGAGAVRAGRGSSGLVVDEPAGSCWSGAPFWASPWPAS